MPPFTEWQITQQHRALRRAEAADRLADVDTDTLEIAAIAADYRAEMHADEAPQNDARRVAALAGAAAIRDELDRRRAGIKTDDRGIEYVEHATVDTLPDGWALCGTCGRAWNDEKSTGWTPTPSGRCPFEYDHEDEDDDQDDARQSLLRVSERERIAVELAGKKYASDDVELADEAPAIEYVDAGYWIGARVFIDAADVEAQL